MVYIEHMESTALTARMTAGTGNTHLANDKTLICGSAAKTARINHLASLETVVTCSRCRKLAGWTTIPGSYQQRTTSGLDSSAWGANKGR